jgi:uncharacterized protein
MTWLGLLVLLFGGWLGLNFAIRRGLAAGRIPESREPADLPWRDVSFPTANGKRLFGWFVPTGQTTPALVVMHGWGGNAEMMLPLAAPLHAAGYALLLVDARCHGRSDEDDFSSLPRFAEDIEASLRWLAMQPEVDSARLGVIGHSVGAGAALLAATRQSTIRAVVSLAAFAHPAAMMRRWLAARHIPFWPFGAYILAYVQWLIGYRFDDIAPINTVAKVRCPLLIVHGDADEMVPVSEARAIFAARTNEQAILLIIPGGHDDYGDIDQQVEVLRHFLERALRQK